MFSIFKRKKEFICCKELLNGIHFDYSGLFYCAEYFLSDGNYAPITEYNDNFKTTYKNFIRQKEKDIKSFKNNKITNRCKNCYQLENKNWGKNKKFEYIAISANTACNSNCIYCTTHKNKERLNKLPDRNIYQIIKEMIDKKQINPDCIIQFGGGEPTIHYEFEDIMNLFLTKLNSTIRIHSSGIKYSKSIEEAIKQTRCMLIISIDSGNPELYRRIKNVDKFNEVTENIKRYCSVLKYSKEPNQVMLKYIIIPGINDSEENILEFLKCAKDLGCSAVRGEIENNWYRKNREEIEKIKQSLYTLKFFDKKAKEIGLWQFFNDTPLLLIDKYAEHYNSIKIK